MTTLLKILGRSVLTVIGLGVFLPLSVQAQSPGNAAQTIPRTLLAFYDPRGLEDLSAFPVHRHLEIALNHLGMDVRYRSALDPLPEDADMAGIRAVVTWFGEEQGFADPNAYCGWLTRQMRRGVRWISLDETGFSKPEARDLSPACAEAFRTLGAEYLGEGSSDELFLEIVAKDPAVVEFERPLHFSEDLRYSLIRTLDPEARAYLRLKRTDLDNSESALVFTTPRGGFVHSGYTLYEDKVLNKIKWRLNPFNFFNAALGLEGLPRPDVTTLNGRRLFMSHIDGDGVFNLSHIDRKSFSSEIIIDKILKKYSELPVSTSIITGYLDIPEYQNPRVRQMYANLFSLPNVEAAAHGHSHTLVWKKGTASLQVPGYVFDAKYEIQGAVERLRGLLKELGVAKPVELFFWTGDCLPTAEQLRYAEAGGLLSVNGGDSRFDRVFDSYAFLDPYGLWRDGARQIYASFPNENIFTNLWKGPFYGFRDIVESFINTENPIRVKPIDIYYHFYSGERMASLMALDQAYAYALTQKITPVFISEYIRIARDFYTTELQYVPGGFRVLTGGALRTVRFDATTHNVDLARSSGVIGFAHDRGNLYVHLDESPEHIIYLTGARPGRPYLAEASFPVRDFKAEGGAVSLVKQGWSRSELVLGGLQPKRTYRVQAGGEVTEHVAGPQGLLSVTFAKAENGGPETRVTVEPL